MSLNDAFSALLLLISGVSAVIVSPPRNVRVSCQNVNISVRWDYSTEKPQTIFRGNISPGNCTFETTDHQHDLSNYIWKLEERYVKFMYVTVAAVQGANQSETVSSNTFSFNHLKTVHTKCSLEFPSIKINVDKLMGTVSFQNPLYFYKELKQVNTDAAKFDFTVSPVGNKPTQGDFRASCTKEETCKSDVLFHEGEEKCVTLTGMLFVGIGVKQVEFKKTNKTCASETSAWKSKDFHEMMLAAILLSILFLIVIALIACICKAKAWTMKTPKFLPKSLLMKEENQTLGNENPPRPDVSPVIICSPHKSLSDSSKDTDDSKDTSHTENVQDSSACFDSAKCPLMGRQHLDSSDPEMEAVGLISDRNSTDDDSADDSTETVCVSSEEEVSPYDRPHVLRMDMGDGDMVMGYTRN